MSNIREKLKEAVKLTLEYHETLNPKLWNGQTLKSEVAKKLLMIAQTWAGFAKIPVKAISDIIVVGGITAQIHERVVPSCDHREPVGDPVIGLHGGKIVHRACVEERGDTLLHERLHKRLLGVEEDVRQSKGCARIHRVGVPTVEGLRVLNIVGLVNAGIVGSGKIITKRRIGLQPGIVVA